MKTNPQLRRAASAQLKGHYTNFVIVTLVYLLIVCACSSVKYASTLLTVLLAFPAAFAFVMMQLDFVRNGENPTVEGLLRTYNKQWYLKTICLQLLMGIYTFLWTLLLVVPGIIKSISYAMAPYILADNPEIGCDEAICRSMKMMDGHKMDYFLILLGYVGLTLLSMLLLCIPLLWIMPYYQVVFTNFYLELKNDAETVNE